MAGHMMYPSPHTVMYASTPALADGGLAVLNAFSQGPSAMQVSHAQAQDTGETPLSPVGGFVVGGHFSNNLKCVCVLANYI